jgi:hypothetical protein
MANAHALSAALQRTPASGFTFSTTAKAVGPVSPIATGSSPERNMIMDHNIDCSTLELREEPHSHEGQEREGQGPPAPPATRLPQRERLPNRRYGYNQKARVGGQKIYF